MSDLSDKVVLIITEAGSAIGAATATLFARLGAKLSLADRNEVNLQRVADELRTRWFRATSHGRRRTEL